MARRITRLSATFRRSVAEIGLLTGSPGYRAVFATLAVLADAEELPGPADHETRVHDKQGDSMANGNTFQARQGDILLIETRAPIERGVGQATEVNREHGVLVIAVGESSGHRHQVAAMGARLLSQNSGATTLLEVTEPGGALIEVTSDRGEPLAHVRHHPVVLRGGLYEIRRQREWSGGRLRGVRD